MDTQGTFKARVRPKRVRRIPTRAQQHFSKTIQIGNDGVAQPTETQKASASKTRPKKKPKLEPDTTLLQNTTQPLSPNPSESVRISRRRKGKKKSTEKDSILDYALEDLTTDGDRMEWYYAALFLLEKKDFQSRYFTLEQLEAAYIVARASDGPSIQLEPLPGDETSNQGSMPDQSPDLSPEITTKSQTEMSPQTTRTTATPRLQYPPSRDPSPANRPTEDPTETEQIDTAHEWMPITRPSDPHSSRPAEQVESRPPSRSAAHLLFQPSTESLSVQGGATDQRSMTPESRIPQQEGEAEVEETESEHNEPRHNKQDLYEEPDSEDIHEQPQRDIRIGGEEEFDEELDQAEGDANTGEEDENITEEEADEQNDDQQTNTYLSRATCSRYETKRQRAQLRKFGKFQPLVARLAERVMIRAIAEHGYADLVSAFTEPDEEGEVLHAGTLFDCWAWEEWREVNSELRPNQPIAPLCAEYKIFARRVFTQLRNSIKAKIFAAVLLCYNLLPGLVDPAEVKDTVRELLDDAFHSPNLQYPDKYPFHHPVIALSIRTAHFGKVGKSIGFQYANELGPIPLPTIALHTTIIHHIISLFGDGEQKDNALHAEHQAEYFEYYLDYLEEASSPSKYRACMTSLTNNMFNFCYSRALNNRPKMEGRNGRVYESDSEEEYISPHVRRQTIKTLQDGMKPLKLVVSLVIVLVS
ncbi:hypothetical protein RhiJN_25113 [Ceratobasidium sp. AG-Ba]|nr:hypothetical protein RhiJN_25113 [Ceratobasidium sp. AG-Ba]